VYLVDNGEWKTHPIFEAAAEPVTSPVRIGTHKLRDKVAVGAMKLYHIKTGLLNTPGSIRELVYHVDNFFDCHRTRTLPLLLCSRVDNLVTG